MKSFEETFRILESFHDAFNERCESDDITVESENISLLNSALILVQRMIEHQYATADRVVFRNGKELVDYLSKEYTYLKPDWK